jgi:flagellar basal-body rod protein FlgB
MNPLFDPTSRLLADMIQGTALRHRVLATNLANVETPGYQAQEVSFAAALESEQGRTGVAPPLRPSVVSDEGTTLRRDGNTVDLDRQMVKLAQNTGWHNAMLQMLSGRFAQLKMAIRDRG